MPSSHDGTNMIQYRDLVQQRPAIPHATKKDNTMLKCMWDGSLY